MKVKRGRCAQHRRQLERQYGSSTQRGYTYRWQQEAKAFLQRYPYCGMRPHEQSPVMSQCHTDGRITLAQQVDHVVPHRGNKQLFWNQANWQALCSSCGGAKSRAGL